MPIPFGPQGPEFQDGDTREEERCHRHIRSAEGGGNGVRSVLARGLIRPCSPNSNQASYAAW